MQLHTSLLLILATVVCTAGAAPSDPCDAEDHLSQVRCTAAAVAHLNVELDDAYRKALKARPEQDESDTRKNRDQLRKSQAAWMAYKEQNCTLLGGLEGGNNLWVTDFAQQCEKEEIEKRIEFLKRVAAGTFGG